MPVRTIAMREAVAFLEMRNRYLFELESHTKLEHMQMRMAAMATALQMTLGLDKMRSVVPKSSALEVLMRAVALELEGDPEKSNSVREKARIGTQMLEQSAS